MTETVNLIVSILSGIAVCIPLVIKLIEYVRKLWKEKNWAPMMQLVLKFMTEAEELYETGAERKEYVMSAIKSLEGTLNYDIDENVISAMIDSIVLASKTINVKPKEEK
jgi:hypothetical protein